MCPSPLGNGCEIHTPKWTGIPIHKDQKVIRVLTISDAIRARGSADFPNYYVIFCCEMPEMKSILLKAPALSNVVPCSVVVHQSEDGKIYATLINENAFFSL